MSSRREEILKEIGITPIWRLRSTDAQRAESAPVETVQSPDAEPQVTALQGSDRSVVAESAQQVSPASRRSSDEQSDRRIAIMRMDWSELKSAVAQCVACSLHAKRNKTVFGVGDENADWMFIGEGPGADEDRLGDPFVGQAGKLLDNMLAAVKLKRGENVYIANIVKCRPPGNRNPEPDEALKCEPFLQRQIELIKPKLIIALGRVAALNLLARDASIAGLRGKVLDYKNTPLIVTYHPAYLLRNLTDKAKAWEDLCFAVKTMESLQSGAGAPSNRRVAE
jgi:uracil-DNA glycosylase family 4